MVFNATFNNCPTISWRSVFFDGANLSIYELSMHTTNGQLIKLYDKQTHVSNTKKMNEYINKEDATIYSFIRGANAEPGENHRPVTSH